MRMNKAEPSDVWQGPLHISGIEQDCGASPQSCFDYGFSQLSA